MNELTGPEFTRLAHNFYTNKNLNSDIQRIILDADLVNYFATRSQEMKTRSKVAFCWICLNPLYWEYAQNMMLGAKNYFLPGHDVDFFLWSDIPKETGDIKKVIDGFKALSPEYQEEGGTSWLTSLSEFIHTNATVFPTEPSPWPEPTLMRYHLFLQQEEILKDYDYIFYCDVDMQFVNVVGDEILGKSLTVAPHPGYYIRKQLYPPYEPNKSSYAYIDRPGILIDDEGKPRFMPFYAAGGLQGGTSSSFIKAMQEMKQLINKDMAKNYTPIWNDETVWNKYVFNMLPKTELEQCVFLNPSYIYPDSLIKEFYEPIVWGQAFPPKLITLTKKFSTSKEGGEAVAKMIGAK